MLVSKYGSLSVHVRHKQLLSYTISAPAWSWLNLEFVSLLLAFRALEVMFGLQSSGMAPRNADYNMIINAHLKRDDEAGALYYWQHMKENGVQPRLYDFTNFMHYYSSKGNVRAVKVSDVMSASDLCEQLDSMLGTQEGVLIKLGRALHSFLQTYCLPHAPCAKPDCRSGKQQLRNMESLTTGRPL